ncbi:FeoA family protein [Hydrogenovibrio sp. SC-1]|uniref:FeoA family protein n=1 Tax=Hydrogenovibrio sp. SC-1 TaxID=2065820 RepID=UPI00117B179F|nr:FeoA family protein [Hydrogenovibrio sp. SC-1]
MTQLPHHTHHRLSEGQAGETYQITALNGDLPCKLHLVNLGFHTDSFIKLILKRHQQWVVSVDGSRFAIGQDIAQQIEVKSAI